jgi:hypothetical protein
MRFEVSSIAVLSFSSVCAEEICSSHYSVIFLSGSSPVSNRVLGRLMTCLSRICLDSVSLMQPRKSLTLK